MNSKGHWMPTQLQSIQKNQTKLPNKHNHNNLIAEIQTGSSLSANTRVDTGRCIYPSNKFYLFYLLVRMNAILLPFAQLAPTEKSWNWTISVPHLMRGDSWDNRPDWNSNNKQHAFHRVLSIKSFLKVPILGRWILWFLKNWENRTDSKATFSKLVRKVSKIKNVSKISKISKIQKTKNVRSHTLRSCKFCPKFKFYHSSD
jgi:hypothetical protein